MEGWRRKLEASDPGLQPTTGDLAELERPLTADEPDAIGRLLTELGDRTEVVVSEITSPIADKLQLLS